MQEKLKRHIYYFKKYFIKKEVLYNEKWLFYRKDDLDKGILQIAKFYTGFLQIVGRWIYIYSFIYVTHQINRLEDKNHAIIYISS